MAARDTTLDPSPAHLGGAAHHIDRIHDLLPTTSARMLDHYNSMRNYLTGKPDRGDVELACIQAHAFLTAALDPKNSTVGTEEQVHTHAMDGLSLLQPFAVRYGAGFELPRRE